MGDVGDCEVVVDGDVGLRYCFFCVWFCGWVGIIDC